LEVHPKQLLMFWKSCIFKHLRTRSLTRLGLTPGKCWTFCISSEAISQYCTTSTGLGRRIR